MSSETDEWAKVLIDDAEGDAEAVVHDVVDRYQELHRRHKALLRERDDARAGLIEQLQTELTKARDAVPAYVKSAVKAYGERDAARARVSDLEAGIAEHMSEKHGLSASDPDDHDERLWALLDSGKDD